MERRHLRLAGMLLVLGTLWTITVINLAGMLTPGYSVSAETISGLGSTFFATYACVLARCNTIYQPASSILVFSFLADGVLLLLSARYMLRASGKKHVSHMISLLGLATFVLGCSYIPLYIGSSAINFDAALLLHSVSALSLVCVGAPLALKADAFARHPLLIQMSRIVGAIIVVAVPLYTYMFFIDALWGPGFGGVERIGFYTIFAWFLGYGVYLVVADN